MIYRTKKGMAVDSSLSMAEVTATLARIPDRFARSLSESYNRYGRFTSDQLAWAHLLAMSWRETGTVARATANRLAVELPAPVPIQAPASRPTVALPQRPAPATLPAPTVPEAVELERKLNALLGGFGYTATVSPQEPAPVNDEDEDEDGLEVVSFQCSAPTAWEAQEAEEEAQPEQPAPEYGLAVDLGTDVFGLFNKAGSKLKYPKIYFEVDGLKLVLSVAGAKSRFPGTINVTDEGKYPHNRFFGRIRLDGTFEPHPACTPQVVAFLKEFAADPIGTARRYGKRTGNCCFCGIPLSTEKREGGRALYSLDLGYGKVCAKNWGLPYGLAAARLAAARLAN